jgi:hypothetical protein
MSITIFFFILEQNNIIFPFYSLYRRERNRLKVKMTLLSLLLFNIHEHTYKRNHDVSRSNHKSSIERTHLIQNVFCLSFIFEETFACEREKKK